MLRMFLVAWVAPALAFAFTLFGAVNAVIGPILRLTGDLTIQTFFWDAIRAALVLSITSIVVGGVVRRATRAAA